MGRINISINIKEIIECIKTMQLLPKKNNKRRNNKDGFGYIYDIAFSTINFVTSFPNLVTVEWHGLFNYFSLTPENFLLPIPLFEIIGGELNDIP